MNFEVVGVPRWRVSSLGELPVAPKQLKFKLVKFLLRTARQFKINRSSCWVWTTSESWRKLRSHFRYVPL